MKELLNDEMLRKIFNALAKGETFEYSDKNTSFCISPNGISIKYNTSMENTKQKECNEFLKWCANLDDDLFVLTCETFAEGELSKLQDQLETEHYKDTIKIFKERVRSVAEQELEKIAQEADEEITRQEEIIKNAEEQIELIHAELDRAQSKYSI
jgi:cell division septum initiation protein DivIVA